MLKLLVVQNINSESYECYEFNFSDLRHTCTIIFQV